MNETPANEPSYAIAAVGGLFLGVLAATAAFIFYAQTPWVLAAMPVAGLLAGLLGTYVASEPYVELKENYERLITAAAADRTKVAHETTGDAERMDAATVVERVIPPEVVEVVDRMRGESARLAREAAGLGEDGLKVAEAAEVLRREAEILRKLVP